MNRSSLARLATITTAAPHEMEMTTTTTAATAFATALIAAATLSGPASAQLGCTSVIMSLSPCMSFIRERGVGPPAAPTAACCTQLGSAVRSQPTCLCAVLNGDATSFGLAVNKTQALALPGACKVNTPPLSQCKAAGVSGAPAASPAALPAAAIPSTPLVPASPASEIPSTTPRSSADSGSRSSRSLIVLLFFLSSTWAWNQ
ncbi:non-specific lipid transfer protein GPI-anchored 5 isoform X2 [Musa acuminata AAA Group]|uniref:non-specific lipid transfer protein GPI-anchored 5 isoform X2 n=1 Tax=Musa acuminata AAA Group TaxID=214697 RepID=UPI0031E28199